MYMFSAFYTFMDETITVDLIENGRDVEVTESNKMEFVKLVKGFTFFNQILINNSINNHLIIK